VEHLEHLARGLDRKHAALVEVVSRAIDRADPIGLLVHGAPDDEYSLEVGTIVPRLEVAASVDDVQQILHEEFVRWFADSAGPLEAYRAIAVEIWDSAQKIRSNNAL